MLSSIVLTLDEYLSQVCEIIPKGLAERRTINAQTLPYIYNSNGDYTPLNLEETISYHRVLSETGITQEEGMQGCAELVTKKYNMRYVVSFPKTILGGTEDNPYICDKLANTFANYIEQANLNIIRANLQAGLVETDTKAFNSNAETTFNAETAGLDFANFPTTRCLVYVDYSVEIKADTDCLLNIVCGEPSDKTLIQICIDNSSCNAIVNAINNTVPQDKIDCIRQGLSNGFSYCVEFVFFQDTKFFFSNTKGLVTEIVAENVLTYDISVNNSPVSVPFQLEVGDFISIDIVKSDPNTDAELCLNAPEFDSEDETLTTVVDVPKNVDDLAVWLDPSFGVTLNYQIQTGNLDSVQFSNTFNAGTVATNFTADDVGKAIRISQPSGNLDTYITAVNSPTQIVTNAAASDTNANNSFFFGTVSTIADKANSNNFTQTIAARQPFFKYDVINQHPVLHKLATQMLNSTSNFRQDATIFMVLKSLETKLTDYTGIFYGDTSTSIIGSWQGERISLGIYQLYGRSFGYIPGLTGSLNTITRPIGTFRTNFNVSTYRDRQYESAGKILTTNSLRVGQTTIYTNTNTTSIHTPASIFQLGAEGSSQFGSFIQIAEFIVYNRNLQTEEVLYIENYLKNKYQI